MSKEHDNRVLSRMGARQLTQGEIARVAGARTISILSVIRTSPASNPDFTLDE
jgi:hypothetical protein